jgi:hypothetical protein
MSSDTLYSEILQKFNEAPTREERVAVLQKHGDARFQDFLLLAFHPDIQFDIEPPPYRPSVEPAGLNWAYLESEIPKMYRFITNHPAKPQGLSADRQRQLLLVILESVHKDEAELIVKMFKKDLGVKYLTKKIIKQAFPNLNLPME